LKHAATDVKLRDFLNGEDPPPSMFAEIEATEGYSSKVFSGWKKKYWRAMCGFTHTGWHHLQRWHTTTSIEPNFTPGEI